MGSIGKRKAVHVFYCILALVFSRDRSVEASSDKEQTLVRIEQTIKSIDSLLSDLIPMMETLAKPPTIANGCTVEFASYGLDDPKPRYGYIRTTGGSSEQIFDPSNEARHRGITLVELDPTTCRTRNRQRFDTWGLVEDTIQLMETIESAAVGTIIVGVTADSAENTVHFQNNAGSLFTRYNMNIRGLNSRDKFAFIMQKGYPKKTVFERKPRYQKSVQMKVQLRGSSVSEVNFVRLL